VQGAAGVEAVRVGRDPAHRVHRDGPADEAVVPHAAASVQGCSTTTGCSKATWAISRARRLIVSAGTPQRSATASGA
jgi:hypothetical protein